MIIVEILVERLSNKNNDKNIQLSHYLSQIMAHSNVFGSNYKL